MILEPKKIRSVTLSIVSPSICHEVMGPVVMYGCKSWTERKLTAEELMLLKYGVGEDSCESLGPQGDQTSQS